MGAGGPISRVLYPPNHQFTPRRPGLRPGRPDRRWPSLLSRRCRRDRAVNPGTSRALIVPLFGLAPGGACPPPHHCERPGALTSRFHPYPGVPRRYVSVALSVGLPRLDVIQHPARMELGLSSPSQRIEKGRPPGPPTPPPLYRRARPAPKCLRLPKRVSLVMARVMHTARA